MKILRIIGRLNIGGPAQNAIFLSEGLNAGDFETLLVAGLPERHEGDMAYLIKEDSIRLIIIPELRRELNLIYDLTACWKIFRIMLKERPEIIHTHTAKAGALGRAAGIAYKLFNGRCRLVHTFHGHVLEGYFGWLKTKAFIFIERFFACFTDKIIVVSESVRSDLLKFRIGAAKKNLVIAVGLDLEKYLHIDVERQSPGDGVFSVGIVGRLAPIKNHKMFLDAVKLLVRDHSLSARFMIVGDGELRGQLEDYACQLNIKEAVRFVGWKRDLAEVYSELDVVCLTSLNEGTPVALIEAMAAGRPVVATDVGGTGDIIYSESGKHILASDKFTVMDNGVLVKSGDIEGFAEAVKLCLQDSELRVKMGQKSRRSAKERFGKERLVSDMKNLYTELTAGAK